jgi:WD40 repeat protein
MGIQTECQASSNSGINICFGKIFPHTHKGMASRLKVRFILPSELSSDSSGNVWMISKDATASSLSQFINRVVKAGYGETAYTFHAKGKFLHSTLADLFSDLSLSIEALLELECCLHSRLSSSADPSPIADVKMNRNGLIAYSAYSGRVGLVKNNDHLSSEVLSRSLVSSICWLNETRFAVGGIDLPVTICTVTDDGWRRLPCTDISSKNSCSSLGFNTDTLAVGSYDGSISLTILDDEGTRLSAARTGTLHGHSGSVSAVSWNNEKLFSVSLDRSFAVWSSERDFPISKLTNNAPLLSLACAAEAGVAISGDSAGNLHLLSVGTPSKVSSWKAHAFSASGCAKAPNDSFTFATCSHQGDVKVWDLRNTKSANQSVLTTGSKILALDWGIQGLCYADDSGTVGCLKV